MNIMIHGGDIYNNKVHTDFSVSLNPLGLQEKIRAAIRRAEERADRYPELTQKRVRAQIAKTVSVNPENVCAGAGASELLLAAVRAEGPKKALLFEPGFSGYHHVLRATGCEIVCRRTREENGFAVTENDLQALGGDIDLVLVCDPGNPSGRSIREDVLTKLLDRARRNHSALILDESFYWEKDRGAGLLKSYENLYIIRSLTKLLCVPGIRAGYVLSSPERIEKLIRQLPEWNLSVTAEEVITEGMRLIGQSDFKQRTQTAVEKERRFLAEGLSKAGCKVFESDSPFLFFRGPADLYDALLQKGILIRTFPELQTGEEGFYRTGLKTRSENEKLLSAIRELLAGSAAGNEGLRIKTEKTDKSEKTEKADKTETAENTDKTEKIEPFIRPEEIEKRSFAILSEELEAEGIILMGDTAPVIKRCIHTSADFSYAQTLTFSPGAVGILQDLIRGGACIVTDTNMALAGINKKKLAAFSAEAFCFMADADVAAKAKERGLTRAVVSMEKAAGLGRKVIFVIGNAPTALIRLHEMKQEGLYTPAFVIGVPVGFVNVVAAKELFLGSDVPHIINRGRKGGSNIAAAICNAVLYEMERDRG